MATRKRKSSRTDCDTADKGWWNKFRHGLKSLPASKSGCRYCKDGNCYQPCHDDQRQQNLRTWHEEWASMNAETQSTMNASGVHECLDDRLSSESTGSQLGNSARAQDRVDTTSDESSGSRLPTSVVDTSDSSGKVDLCSSAEEHETEKPRRTYNRCKTRSSRWAIKFLGHMVCQKAAMSLMRIGPDRLAKVMAGKLSRAR